jgi:hypothetical protein
MPPFLLQESTKISGPGFPSTQTKEFFRQDAHQHQFDDDVPRRSLLISVTRPNARDHYHHVLLKTDQSDSD